MTNIWHVMDAGRDSVDRVKRLLDRYKQRLNYAIQHPDIEASLSGR